MLWRLVNNTSFKHLKIFGFASFCLGVESHFIDSIPVKCILWMSSLAVSVNMWIILKFQYYIYLMPVC